MPAPPALAARLLPGQGEGMAGTNARAARTRCHGAARHILALSCPTFTPAPARPPGVRPAAAQTLGRPLRRSRPWCAPTSPTRRWSAPTPPRTASTGGSAAQVGKAADKSW
eukprot:356247-Chlamydomonas_euryale.AAC.5